MVAFDQVGSGQVWMLLGQIYAGCVGGCVHVCVHACVRACVSTPSWAGSPRFGLGSTKLQLNSTNFGMGSIEFQRARPEFVRCGLFPGNRPALPLAACRSIVRVVARARCIWATTAPSSSRSRGWCTAPSAPMTRSAPRRCGLREPFRRSPGARASWRAVSRATRGRACVGLLSSGLASAGGCRCPSCRPPLHVPLP